MERWNKMQKKILLLLVVCVLFMSNLVLGDVIQAVDTSEKITPSAKDPKPIDKYDSEWLPILRKGAREGIIMKDKPQVPGSATAALALTNDPPESHTGWSATVYECERYITHYQKVLDEEGKITEVPHYAQWWKILNMYSTNNRSDSGMLGEYATQLSALYSDLGVEDWYSARGYLAGVDAWSIYTHHHTGTGDCQPGDLSYYYNNNDILMEGAVQVHLPDPTNTQEAPNRNKGAVKGEAYWELRRDDVAKGSNVHGLVDLAIAGEHYATRQPKNMVTFNGKSTTTADIIKVQATAKEVKGEDMTYGFTYEYTNHYKDIYTCTDKEGSYCYQWTFNERIPDWDYVQTFTVTDKMKMDHRQKDNVNFADLDSLKEAQYLVGRKDSWNLKKTSKAYHEKIMRAPSNTHENTYDLITQSTLPATPGALKYTVELPSGLHSERSFMPLKKELTNGHIFPADIDESLQEEYKTTLGYGEYAFPLQQHTMIDKGFTKDEHRIFEFDYVTDAFFISKHMGYMVGVPYAAHVKANLLEVAAEKPLVQVFKEGERKLQREFERDFGVTYVDENLYNDASQDFAKVQRHYLPVSPKSILHPGENYKNHINLQNVGLNDLIINYAVPFSFRHYLFGSGADEAFYIEQKDSRVPVPAGAAYNAYIKYEDLAKFHALEEERKNVKRVHELRIADRDFIEKVKAIMDIGL